MAKLFSIRIGVLVLLTTCLSFAARAQNLAITGGRVYITPNAKPRSLDIIIRDGKIERLSDHLRVPRGFRVIECTGCFIFSGFWNAHVHFVAPEWNDTANVPAARLTSQLRQMLTHSGFTTVVDCGSDVTNTVALRRRVESGEVDGPKILTAGFPLYPPDGIPYYIKDLPTPVLAMLPQPHSAAEAATAVERNISAGSNVAKLFTGSYVSQSEIKVMPLAVAAAAMGAAHADHQVVLAHASNLAGVRVAIQSGVDILAHAPDTVEGLMMHSSPRSSRTT